MMESNQRRLGGESRRMGKKKAEARVQGRQESGREEEGGMEKEGLRKEEEEERAWRQMEGEEEGGMEGWMEEQEDERAAGRAWPWEVGVWVGMAWEEAGQRRVQKAEG